MHPVVDTWVYLSASPAAVADADARRLPLRVLRSIAAAASTRLVNPVAIAIASLLLIVLLGTHTSYLRLLRRRAVRALPARARDGRAGGAAARELGQAPDALGLRSRSRSIVGVLVSIGIGVLIGHLRSARRRGRSPRSRRSPSRRPWRWAISEKLGGIPSLTAVCVVITGIVGSAFRTLHAQRDADPERCARSRGARLRAGDLAAHGQGVARAVPRSARRWARSPACRWASPR